MNISSVVIRCRPETLPGLRHALAALPGVEVHGEHADGRLVVTLEDCDVCSAADSYVALHTLPGVLSATLVFQYGDDDTPAGTSGPAAVPPESEVNQQEV